MNFNLNIMKGRIETEKIYEVALLEMPKEFTSYDFKNVCRNKGVTDDEFHRYFVSAFLKKRGYDNGHLKGKTWSKKEDLEVIKEDKVEMTLQQAIEIVKENGGKVLMPIMTEI